MLYTYINILTNVVVISSENVTLKALIAVSRK